MLWSYERNDRRRSDVIPLVERRGAILKLPVDNVVIATKGLQDRNINTQAGTTVENKGKLILIEEEQTQKYLDVWSTKDTKVKDVLEKLLEYREDRGLARGKV